MAIYHFSVKEISRNEGRSAVACSAYRSGEKLIDERQGKEQDYTRKTGVEFKKIYAPENTKPELLDRNQLWNTVEKVERRKDSNLAREFEIAFPHELNAEQRQTMLNELCQKLVKRHGVIVDAAIHAPHTKSGSDERNYHAHIMFTGRQIDTETGDFAKKRNRDFNKENSSQTVSEWRKTFADLTNQHLARAGYLSEVDHRSYADQDNGLQATIHEGSKVTQLRRQGVDTEISLKNDFIKQQNAEKQRLPEILKGLEQEIFATEKLQSKLEADLLEAKLQEQQRLEAEQQKAKAEQLERDVSRFYEMQQRYMDFTYTMLELYCEKEAKIAEIKKNRQKIEKFVAKCPLNDSIIRKEETAYELKKGYVPDFFISKENARSKIQKIEEKYAKDLQALAKEDDFLTTATELTLLHKSLLKKEVELEIPRQKKIFGIAISSSVPPSAETLEADLDFYFFKPLSYDFEYKYKQAIRSDVQKKKDADEMLQRDLEMKARWSAAEQESIEARKNEKARQDASRDFEKGYGYRTDCEYDALSAQVSRLSSLIVSEARKGRDISGYMTEKIAILDGELKRNYTKEHSKKVYCQIFEILAADKKLLKSDLKNLNNINDFYDKLTNHVAEKKEIEQLKIERERKELEVSPTKQPENNSSNDGGVSKSMLALNESIIDIKKH